MPFIFRCMQRVWVNHFAQNGVYIDFLTTKSVAAHVESSHTSPKSRAVWTIHLFLKRDKNSRQTMLSGPSQNLARFQSIRTNLIKLFFIVEIVHCLFCNPFVSRIFFFVHLNYIINEQTFIYSCNFNVYRGITFSRIFQLT